MFYVITFINIILYSQRNMVKCKFLHATYSKILILQLTRCKRTEMVNARNQSKTMSCDNLRYDK